MHFVWIDTSGPHGVRIKQVDYQAVSSMLPTLWFMGDMRLKSNVLFFSSIINLKSYRFLFVESTLLSFRCAIVEAFIEECLDKVVFGFLLVPGHRIQGIRFQL